MWRCLRFSTACTSRTSTLQWVVSAYAVTFGGFLLLGGRLADVFGRARLYRIGLCVFVVASISGGLAVEPRLLIASRAVQGLGAALLAPAGLSLLVTSWPDEGQRSHALGVYGAVASAGFAAGAVIGGLLVQASWRLVFFVNVPVGVVLFVASWRLLPADPPRQPGRLDVAGALAVTAGVALLVLGVTRAGDTLEPTQPAVAVGAGLVLLVSFVVRERKAAAPLLNLDLFKDRGILGANECLLAYGACNAGAVLLVTLYLQEGRGLSAASDGAVLHPAGRRGLRPGRSGLEARPCARASPRPRGGHVARPARSRRLRTQHRPRTACRVARLPVLDGDLGPHRPGRLDPGGDARAGGRPGRGLGQRGADRVASGRLCARRGRRVGHPGHCPRERQPPHRRGHARRSRLRSRRPARDAHRAERPGAAALVATRAPLPPPRRRTSLTLYPNLFRPSGKCRLRAVSL